MLIVNFEETEDIGIVTHYKGKPLNGIGRHLYENGKTKLEIEMVEGLKHGKSTGFYEDGILKSESHYKDDKLNGIFKVFNKKGIIIREGSFIDDKKEGIHKEYNDVGVLVGNLTYKDDKIVKLDLKDFLFDKIKSEIESSKTNKNKSKENGSIFY